MSPIFYIIEKSETLLIKKCTKLKCKLFIHIKMYINIRSSYGQTKDLGMSLRELDMIGYLI